MNVSVPIVIAAAIAVTAEHRAGPSRHRPYRAANHRPHRSADRSPGGDASESADRLGGVEQAARPRHARENKAILFTIRILPQYRHPGNTKMCNVFRNSPRRLEGSWGTPHVSSRLV